MALPPTSFTNAHSSFEVIPAPQSFTNRDRISIFLSGSIDIGKEVIWQTAIIQAVSHLPVVILDPFRPDWDSTWKEDMSFPPFRNQVTWELDMRETADVVAIYFGPEAKATITLLELGLTAHTEKAVVVCCPAGYWKRGNVEAVCERYGVEMVESIDDLARNVLEKLREMGIA